MKPQLSEDAVNLTQPMTFPKLASYKLDGIRCTTHYGAALSRSLKPIPNRHICDTLAPWKHLDGELTVGSPTSKDVRRVTNSGVRSIEGRPDFKFYVFDDTSNLAAPFEQRLAKLRARARELPYWIEVLEQFVVTSQEELQGLYTKALETGYEGLILRNPGSIYKFGRCTLDSQDSLKFKPHLDSEGVVVGTFEGVHNDNEAFTNELGRTARSSAKENLRPSGQLGGFIVNYEGATINVAPGRSTHAERKAWWEQRETLIGRVLTFRHMPINFKDAPNFARFISWREPFDM